MADDEELRALKMIQGFGHALKYRAPQQIKNMHEALRRARSLASRTRKS
jgi:hypothetical protein